MKDKLQIEKPDWLDGPSYIGGGKYYAYSNVMDFWNDHVQPINKMLSEGVEVYWAGNETNDSFYPIGTTLEDCDTRKGILINIEEIKPKSREENLEEFVKSIADGKYGDINKYSYFIDKARQLLGDE